MIYQQKNKSNYIDTNIKQKNKERKRKKEKRKKEKSTELITVHCSAGKV